MKATIAVLPGDGIGPEVVGKATELLSVIAHKYGHEFIFVEGLIGGIAIDETGDPLPAETVKNLRRGRRHLARRRRWS